MLMVISTTCGCLMYAYFRGCDPTLSGQINFEDQTVPFLVLNVFRDVPGIAGLFVSAAYSAMLRSVWSRVARFKNGKSGQTGISLKSGFSLKPAIFPISGISKKLVNSSNN